MSISVFGVCGVGTMGVGIAYSAALAGMNIRLYDFPNVLENGKSKFSDLCKASVTRGKLTQKQADELLARVYFSSNLESFADCDIVVEAIIENLGIKQELFKKLEAITPSDCILASNTSSLAITAIFSALKNPERGIGMHFFNPAHIMKLVEVINGFRTSPSVTAATIDITRALGKTPVIAKDTPGFIVNRVARNFYGEALRIVGENKSDYANVDECMRNVGFKMGPFELMDLIGIDINFAVTQSVYSQYFNEPRFQPHIIQSKMVEAGLLGKKSGSGFYNYNNNSEI